MKANEERALRNFPETFRSELAAIQAGARNGGVISPRRNQGLLVDLERVKKKYGVKIVTLRSRGQSTAIDEVEVAIAKVATEFEATIWAGKAA